MAGRTYYISIRAKTDPEQGLIKDTASIHPRYFEISLGGYGNRKFELSPDWQEFVTSVTIPYPEEDLQPKLNVILQMPLSLIHISEPTRLLSISYAVFCLKNKKHSTIT